MTDDTAAQRARDADAYDYGGKKTPEQFEQMAKQDAGFGHHNVFERERSNTDYKAKLYAAIRALEGTGRSITQIAELLEMPRHEVARVFDGL